MFGKKDSVSIFRMFMKQLLTAVEYLHNKNIVHRDLKVSKTVNIESRT